MEILSVLSGKENATVILSMLSGKENATVILGTLSGEKNHATNIFSMLSGEKVSCCDLLEIQTQDGGLLKRLI